MKIIENESASWLCNSSCLDRISSNNFVDLSSESSDETLHNVSHLNKQASHNAVPSSKPKLTSEETRRLKHNKRKKKEKKRHTCKVAEKLKYEQIVDNVYFEDKYRDKGNNTVKTLCSRVRPYYDIKRNSLGFISYKQPKKNFCKRYYAINIDSIQRRKKADSVIKKELTINSLKEEECLPFQYNDFEELQKSKTKEYNERLANNMNDIKLWLEYIDFQVCCTLVHQNY